MYVFDTSSLIILFQHFYPDRFPSLWENFDLLISNGAIVSVREVINELEKYGETNRLVTWIEKNRGFFPESTPEELLIVREIFSVSHFQFLIEAKKRLGANPVADPFVIAKAKVLGGTVVTEEKYKKNSAKIPNVCEYFEVSCINLEEFMEKENWIF